MTSFLHSTVFALVAAVCVPASAQGPEADTAVAPEPAEEDVLEVEDAGGVSTEEVQPGAPPISDEERKELERVGREFLQASYEMWNLLSGVRSKADADAAADRMTALVARIYALDEKMGDSPVVATDASCNGMLDSLQVLIMDSLESVNEEFLSLRRLHCYGSERLIRAFRLAGRAGLFAEEDVDSLSSLPDPFTPQQAAAELTRLGRLQEQDRNIAKLLATVVDSASAQAAVTRLGELCVALRELTPRERQGVFPDERATEVQAVVEPLRRALWGIRNEIVRLAALPGYAGKPFDSFSEQLDDVFSALEGAHSVWFEDVFDASFRSDLEDAFHENLKTSKS